MKLSAHTRMLMHNTYIQMIYGGELDFVTEKYPWVKKWAVVSSVVMRAHVCSWEDFVFELAPFLWWEKALAQKSIFKCKTIEESVCRTDFSKKQSHGKGI